MILSRVAINAEIDEGRLRITPLSSSQIGVSSVDLTLSERLLLMPKPEDAGPIIEPSKNGFDVMKEMYDRCEVRLLRESDPYTLFPGEFVLAWTKEWIELPTSLAGRVEGKSSMGSFRANSSRERVVEWRYAPCTSQGAVYWSMVFASARLSPSRRRVTQVERRIDEPAGEIAKQGSEIAELRNELGGRVR